MQEPGMRSRRLVAAFVGVQVLIPSAVLIGRALGSEFLRFGWAMFSTAP